MMFSLEKIAEAHARMESGVDFPTYVADLKKLGVGLYEMFVSDGHIDYFSTFQLMSSQPRHEKLEVADACDLEAFKKCLKAHQDGQTDFPEFCADSARFGIWKWAVAIEKRTCTYFDKSGKAVLVESIRF